MDSPQRPLKGDEIVHVAAEAGVVGEGLQVVGEVAPVVHDVQGGLSLPPAHSMSSQGPGRLPMVIGEDGTVRGVVEGFPSSRKLHD